MALNTAASGADVGDNGTYTSNDYNLIGVDDLGSVTAQSNDLIGTTESPIDPMAEALADNGGPTLTHALLDGSPAYDAGDPADDFADQRGEVVFGDSRDIGSFEAQVNLSIDEFVELLSNTRLYPNPVLNGQVNLQIPSEYNSEVAIRIFEIGSGKLVYSQKGNTGVNTISVNNLSVGTYVVQLVQEDTVRNIKMIVGR